MKPSPKVGLGELLRLERRKVKVEPDKLYQEIGIYCFGRGIVHKTPRTGFEVGDKDLFLMKEGDFILQVTFAWEGAIAIVSAAEEGMYGSTRYPTFRVDESRCLPHFLLNYFKTHDGLQQLIKICPGSAGRNRVLSIKRIPEVFVPLPPLAEQRRVVTRIEELAAQIHGARTLRHQATEEVEALPTAQTSRLFEELLKGKRHPIRTLGCDGENPIQIGPFGGQLHRTEFVEDGTPVLNVGNVWPDGLRLDYLDHVTEEKAHQLRRYSIKTGDLLFARSGATLGKVCLVPPECDAWLMTGHLFRVRFDSDRVFNRFAFAALRGSLQIQKQVLGQVRGATRPGYNTTLLGTVELPAPPLPEQRRIVAELDVLQAELDALKRLQAETAAELDALLPAIRDRAFKGDL